MNRILTIIAIAVLAFMTSCGQGKPQPNVAENTEQQSVLSSNDMSEENEIPVLMENGVKTLLPYVIEEFKTFVPYDENNDEDWDGGYPYRDDPNGNWYHFETYVAEWDSQWDGLELYQEEFSATSTLPQEKSTRYDANNLRNNAEGGGNRATTWCEGAKGYGIGERINMTINTKSFYEGKEKELCFKELLIVNGFAKNATTWKNNTRVKTLRLYIGGKQWCDLQLKDIMKPQIFKLPKDLEIFPGVSGKKIPLKKIVTNVSEYNENTPAYQIELIFEIIEVYPGDKYDDTCITGIAVNVYTGIY
jgi:hypothetical protein